MTEINDQAQSATKAPRRPDIARVNLELATDLPHGDPDVDACLATLDEWVELCRAEIRRAKKEFKKDPGYYDHSRATFCMMCIVTVVQRDLGVRYNPDAVGSYSFSDARDCFIHGLLDDRRLGTCVTIPVLYVAIGRRLGYPVHLALAKGHVFARWQQDHGETVNVEATNLGLTTHPDSHYRQWPRPISDAEAADYLRPLLPDEELAVFTGTRGHCLEDNGRYAEALACYARAGELQPRPHHYAGHATRLRAQLGHSRIDISLSSFGLNAPRPFSVTTPGFITANPPAALTGESS